MNKKRVKGWQNIDNMSYVQNISRLYKRAGLSV